MRHSFPIRTLPLLISAIAIAGCACSTTPFKTTPPIAGEPGPSVVLNNLLSTELEGVENTEVIVSHVTIPPNTSLPKHWHPGEEFAYVLEGSVTLWQEGKRDVTGSRGDVVKVPLKQIHTAITGDEGVKLLVFRVHEQGQPGRILVD